VEYTGIIFGKSLYGLSLYRYRELYLFNTKNLLPRRTLN